MFMVHDDAIFADRKAAGIALGNLLKEQYKGMGALVLGIPRGGVEVAYEVARILQADLSVLITKKLPHPAHPELAIGAATEDGSVYLNSHAANLTDREIRHIVDQQLQEIRSRIRRFREGRSVPLMKDRIVIVADDGIATGATLVPALQLIRKQQPAKVVVAAPVSGKHFVPEINQLADEIKVLVQPDNFYSVSQVYEDFHGLVDEEVTGLLKDFQHDRLSYG